MTTTSSSMTVSLEQPRITMLNGAEQTDQFLWDIQLAVDNLGLLQYIWDSALQFRREPAIGDIIPKSDRDFMLSDLPTENQFLYSKEDLKACGILAWQFKEGFMLDNIQEKKLYPSRHLPPSQNAVTVRAASSELRRLTLETLHFQDQLRKFKESMQVLGLIKNSVAPGIRELLSGVTSPLMALHKLQITFYLRTAKTEKTRQILSSWEELSSSSMGVSEYHGHVALMCKQLRALDNEFPRDLIYAPVMRYLPEHLKRYEGERQVIKYEFDSVSCLLSRAAILLESTAEFDVGSPDPYDNDPLYSFMERLESSDDRNERTLKPKEKANTVRKLSENDTVPERATHTRSQTNKNKSPKVSKNSSKQESKDTGVSRSVMSQKRARSEKSERGPNKRHRATADAEQ